MDIKKAREDLRRGKTIYDMPLRVVYYGRVSTDKDDQLNSLENQQNYFEEMINENKNWIFCGGYLDEGISGTAVKNRDSFLKMVEQATLGKIDLILTKEISRFSRNTVDSIKYTEYLLKNGVIVYFLSDNLNTIQEDAEFRLTIMSSLAQDEVRKLSERVKFGINRMIKDRKLIGGNLTGYFKKDGRYEINPKEAPIITYLFETYASGKVGLKKIGEDLAKMGYLNSKGEVYSQTTMAKFLTNPRYKGYYTARLTEVEDYKTHKKKKVAKEKQIIEKDDRIPAIVSEELWDKANALHEKRKSMPARHILNKEEAIEHSKYSCLIYCKHCNSVYTRNGGSNRANNPTWACKTYRTQGVATCESPIIRESYLDKIFINIFDDFIKNKKSYLDQVMKEYKSILDSQSSSINIEDINNQIAQLDKQKDKLLDLSLKGIISDSEFQKRNDKFNQEIFKLNQQITNIKNDGSEIEKMKQKLDDLRNSLSTKIDVKEQLPFLTKLLIERVEVEKINNDRKHIKLTIYFNFNADIVDRDLDLHEKKIKPEKKEKVNFKELTNSFIQKCTCIDHKIHSSQYRYTNIEVENDTNIDSYSNLCSYIDQKQSWSGYNYTYKFVENPLNDVKQTNIVEVHTTYEIVCNGIAYIDDTEYNSPNDVLCYVNNIKKERLRISKKMYNINSNSYKNITANKSVEVVNLYNEFEKYILGKDKKLIRNFLVKGIVFKQKIRMAEVVLKSRELTIVFLRDVKEYDNDNLLTVQKGREKQRLCLAMTVSNADELEYAKRIFDKEYELINDKSEEKRINELYTILYSKIKGINKSVSAMKINKGTIFKGKRNFCILEKRKYGYNIRLLPVEDTDNILGVVGRSKYEPLCRYFKVKNISDIDIIMPYLERAYEITKYPAIDIKNGITDHYVK